MHKLRMARHASRLSLFPQYFIQRSPLQTADIRGGLHFRRTHALSMPTRFLLAQSCWPRIEKPDLVFFMGV
jgi:hypothetical protein